MHFQFDLYYPGIRYLTAIQSYVLTVLLTRFAMARLLLPDTVYGCFFIARSCIHTELKNSHINVNIKILKMLYIISVC